MNIELELTHCTASSLRLLYIVSTSVTSKKSPNVYKSCPKKDFASKMKDFDKFTKIPFNVLALWAK